MILLKLINPWTITFIFLVSHENALLKAINPSKIYQNTKFHDTTLTGASLDVRHFGRAQVTRLESMASRLP
jgi:hypothetical protein